MPLNPAENLIEGEPPLFQFTMTKRIGWEACGTHNGVYVFLGGAGKFGAFSNVCTHLSCLYIWREDSITSYALLVDHAPIRLLGEQPECSWGLFEGQVS